MMQKIMFQDNLYQLARSIDTVSEGLLLDLSGDFFFDKTVDDLLFFDASIRKIAEHLSQNTQISGYTKILHNLYSSQTRYIEVLNAILSGTTCLQEQFEPLKPKLQEIREHHTGLKTSIVSDISKIDVNSDSRDIVSTNELSELLNF
jgi:hypothetical protein